MTDCPSAEQLGDWLNERLTSASADTLEAHVEGCARCQQVLEDLTASDTASGHLAAAGGESGAEFLHRLEQEQPTPQFPRRDDAAGPPALPGYEIQGELGRGGMGVVYKARQISLNRVVALKVIRAGEYVEPRQRGRFQREAELGARLQHPNIVRVYEVGVHAGRPYLALEFIDGQSLAQRSAGVPQEPRWAAQMVETLARAVHEAHREGVIHRDLKPANVLLTPDGVPRITDFGLACQPDAQGRETARLTMSGQVVGTPSYMAPEQAEGGKPVGPAADVYALGAILYELLTGQPPFVADTPLQTLRRVVGEEPVPPRRLQPKLPVDLETILLKAMEKAPERRFASAEEMAEELRRFLADEPLRIRPAGRIERLRRWQRHNPVVANLLLTVAGLLLLLVAGGVAGTLLYRAEAETARAAERKATDSLRAALLSQARALLQSGQAGQRQGALEAIEQAARHNPTDEERQTLRNLLLEALALPDLVTDPDGPSLPPDGNGLAFDASYERCAVSTADGRISIRRTSDGAELLRLAGQAAKGARLEFDPTGRYLAVWYSGQKETTGFRVWDLERRAPVPGLPERNREGHAFDPRGGRIALAGTDPVLALYTLPDGGPQPVPLPALEGVTALAFSPDGRHLAVAGKAALGAGTKEDRWQVLRLDAETGRTETLHGSQDMILTLAWHPEGESLAWAAADKSITVAGLRGTILARLHGHTAAVGQLAFTPDGRRLVSVAPPDGLCVWDPLLASPVVRMTLGGSFALAPHGEVLGGVQSGAVFRMCRLVTGELRLLSPRPGATSTDRPRADGDGAVRALSFHPDGRLLASGDGVGVLLWDTYSGRSVARLVPAKADQLPPPVPKAPGPIWARKDTEPGSGRRMGRVGQPRDRLRDLPRWFWASFTPEGRLLYGDFQSGILVRDVQPIPGGVRVGAQGRPFLGEGEHGFFRAVALAGDGRTIAGIENIPRSDLVTVVRIGDPAANRDLAGRHYLWNVTLTGDGRLAAASAYLSEVRVWDVRTGEIVRDLPDFGSTLSFSPDGNWLVTGSEGEYRLRDTRTWEVRGQFARANCSEAGPMAFTEDSTLLAIAAGPATVRLIDVERAAELATLPIPRLDTVSALRFSHDGAWLAVGTEGSLIHLWDLRAVRKRLRSAGLDWDGPLPPPAQGPTGPLQVEVE